MKKIFKLAFPLAALSLFSGCASIVNGTNQPVSVETRLNGAQVAGAYCTLVNDKGTWFVTSPGSVTIHRSMTDLNVKCEKSDIQPGMADVKSSTKGMAFGNILFGGVIGAGVDIANGSAFDYPTLIQVQMGNSIVIAPHAPEAVADKANAANSATLQANADNASTASRQ
ncbi:MAG: hypothetical protein P4L77_07570 [Sulfuriferula sp.]|nr:hypothetical protein [Sulfuriferula sp.]